MREADCMAVRRAAVLLAALLMGVVTVSGCGGSETETSPTTTHTITRTATVPSATGTVVSTTATTKPGGHACTNLRLTESGTRETPEQVRSRQGDARIGPASGPPDAPVADDARRRAVCIGEHALPRMRAFASTMRQRSRYQGG